MLIRIISILLVSLVHITFAQEMTSHGSDLTTANFASAKAYQDQLNATYKNPDSTILSRRALRKFKGLKFWPINLDYIVKANFTEAVIKLPVEIATSSGHSRTYHTYGKLNFAIRGEQHELVVLQNPKFVETPSHKYADHLMLGFTDQTSGDGSYSGGRYVDILISEIIDNQIIIDFNKAYNPYCAYTVGYSCAIPPSENEIEARIEAGVKAYKSTR